MAGKNLWGNLDNIEKIRTPHEILREQGSVLVELTHGLLNFEIERKQKNTLFSYNFSITAPNLNFCQPLLRITHDIKIFPSILRNEQSGDEYTANGEKEFQDDLGSILSSAETKNLVSGLIAQARLAASMQDEGEIMV